MSATGHDNTKQIAGLPSWRRQAATLSDRYLDAMLGDLATLLLLVGQAPVIAALCVVVWSGVETDTKSLYFVLSLTAVWCGCINACREIVKERPIFARERLFGLSSSAYVISKARVLFGIDVIQVAFLLGIVEWKIGLKGSLVWQSSSLLLCAFAGTGLGLLISSLTRRQERAVAAVPLLILPQILFSEFAIPREAFGTVTELVEKGMIVRWGYRIFTEAAAVEPGYGDIILSIGVLLVMTAALHLAAIGALASGRPDKYL
jgi:hypothetical protein